MSTTAAPIVEAPVRPPAGRRADAVTALLSTWFTVGLFLDAWAHNNVPQLETFFTPWHAVFYSGFVATAAWIGWLTRQAWRSSAAPWVRFPQPGLVPRGYLAALFALPGFALFGLADLCWHLVFGIEQNLAILFSPTHLGLAATMLVIVTAPLRTAWSDPDLPSCPGMRRLGPAVVASALAATLVLLFLQYANVLALDSVGIISGLSGIDDGFTSRLVSSLVVTNLVLITPVLALARRWKPPLGTVTVVYAAAGGLSLAVTGFADTDTVLGLLAGGVLADLIGRALRPDGTRAVRYLAFAALTPLVSWASVITVAYLTVPEVFRGQAPLAAVALYTGAPLVQALAGVLVATLLRADRPR